ncbi:ABC transporter permease [Cellulomonas marina]|uniref:NitT/TauT family transport system permease protein n=1 Tax=Cellulomonas marina TaxID=988821 RepID=A0A1I0V8Z7_9CELL|nr:ABC transporter permease [Cellulomonas marina]GIG29226.1 nitrate ABC transporter permease [Cellulomonas marina]SFA72527.1 NitT/TauT family transport system permease protein [Cellulomonas marina]
MTRRRGRTPWWQPLVVLVALIGLWYAAAASYARQELAFLVPYPHLVLRAMVADPTFTPQLLRNLGNSTVVALTGLVIAIAIGVAWAVLMAQARWIERSLYPYAVILQCIPILALVPLIGALFGYEFASRVIVTVMISIFPMVSNTLFGLQSVDRAQRELFALQGASTWTVLTKLRFPAALPSLFVGLRTAAGLSVIGAIVGDQFFQRGTPGLGVLIQVSTSRLNGPGTFAAILTASLLGVAVFLLFGWLRTLVVGRWSDAA